MTTGIDLEIESNKPSLEATPQPVGPPSKHLPVASRLHLTIFLAFHVVIIMRSGTMLPRLIAIKDQPSFRVYLPCCYLVVITFELAQLLFVWYGIKQTNTTISDLVDGRWSSMWEVIKDVLFAGALWLLWMIAAIVLVIAFHPAQHETPKYYVILPHSALEVSLWLVMSVAAGFCEEIVYRGYLQRQFLALGQSLPLAIFFQALVFAAVHRYEGAFNVLVICAMAILFGSFAARRKSLRPGIIAHTWHDGLIGAVYFLMNRYR
jgi:membrane protease YdiL (CAAX protease family)